MFLFFYEGGDKTEEPTPHRLREARRKGQVFKSMELNSALNIIGVMALLMAFSSIAFRGFEDVLYNFIGDMLILPLTFANTQAVFQKAIMHYLAIMAPIFAVALVVGVASNLVQVGFLTSTEQMAPQLKRINPLEGLKKIVSKKALFEMVKAILKIVIISTVTYLFVVSRIENLLLLVNQPVAVSLNYFWHTITALGLVVGLVFLLLAFMDYLFQRYEHKTSLKMSRKEIKDEHKHMEGDPLVKSKLREKQRQLARERMIQDVPSADVVITNPTELAVALVYKAGQDGAPKITAMGAAIMARRIREVARKNDIAIIENPPVAQMLWKYGNIGEEIPVELYQAVAEIMAAVYRIREKSFG